MGVTVKGRGDCSFSSLYSPVQCPGFPIGPPRKLPSIRWQPSLTSPWAAERWCHKYWEFEGACFCGCSVWELNLMSKLWYSKGKAGRGNQGLCVQWDQPYLYGPLPVSPSTQITLWSKQQAQICFRRNPCMSLEDSLWLLDFVAAILQIKYLRESADKAQSVECLSFTKLWVWPPALYSQVCVVWHGKAVQRFIHLVFLLKPFQY